MMQFLTTFVALSMVTSVLLTLLPEGGIKRTAGMAMGLLTLLCWAESIATLLNIDWNADFPTSVLSSTAITLETAATGALTALQEVLP